jgi:hypothetical protein
MGAAAAAAGTPRTLQQAMQWLQLLRDTPLLQYSSQSIQCAAGIRTCMKSLLAARDAMGRLDAETEQELFAVLKLLCNVFVQLLRQAPAAAAGFKQHAAHATTNSGILSNNSHTGSGSNSSGASTSHIKLDDLFVWLASALSDCVLCLPGTSFMAARPHKEAGEHLPCSQTFDFDAAAAVSVLGMLL